MGQAQLKERPRLLFVDDEQRVLNSMRIMFRREYDLYLADRGADALKIIRDNDIDVIVADHRMPQMTGVEVLTQVRAQSPRTVRILLTGYADLDAVEGSINDGEVFRFLTKPCPPAQLKETVSLAAKLALETSAAEDELGEDSVEIVLQGDHFEAVETGAREATSPAVIPPSATPVMAEERSTTSDTAELPTVSSLEEIESDFDPTITSAIERPAVLPQAPKKQSPGLARGLGIIVFSVDDEVRETIQRAVRGRVPVYSASNIVKVVKLLSEHQPGVLVTDVSDDKATIQSMTANLKQHLPELVTIAVSEHRDVLDMVWLINHGQTRSNLPAGSAETPSHAAEEPGSRPPARGGRVRKQRSGGRHAGKTENR